MTTRFPGGVTADVTGDVTGDATGDLTGGWIEDSFTEFNDTDGTIAVPTSSALYLLTDTEIGDITLNVPTATTDDGKRITFTSATAKAHTITTGTIGYNGAGASYDKAVLGGAVGDGFTVVAYNGYWCMTGATNVTLS
jgi:hypothetical protein